MNTPKRFAVEQTVVYEFDAESVEDAEKKLAAINRLLEDDRVISRHIAYLGNRSIRRVETKRDG